MKDKNRILKLIGSGLLMTLLGAVLGFAFTKTIENGIGDIPDSFILLTLVFSFVTTQVSK